MTDPHDPAPWGPGTPGLPDSDPNLARRWLASLCRWFVAFPLQPLLAPLLTAPRTLRIHHPVRILLSHTLEHSVNAASDYYTSRVLIKLDLGMLVKIENSSYYSCFASVP